MTEIAARARFDRLRYAQVWEDADILLAALDVQPGDVCLSIASAGDNALALLTRRPSRVLAVDLSRAQLAALELRVAAFTMLTHGELLELIGSRPSRRRAELYARTRAILTAPTRQFWDAQPRAVARGIGGAGKFERYFALFRRAVLPLLLPRADVQDLLVHRPQAAREVFYARKVETWRWNVLFRAFFSRAVMGRLGRDPAFFRYVQGEVGPRIAARAKHALTVLDPAENPYLHWIVTGTHAGALPLYLREEHFDTIQNNLHRLEWRHGPIEQIVAELGPCAVHRFNLSDIFEYMGEARAAELLGTLADAGRPGGRLVYWNMLAPRSRPESLADVLRPRPDLAAPLHARDKAFFYSRLVIEEVI